MHLSWKHVVPPNKFADNFCGTVLLNIGKQMGLCMGVEEKP